MKVSKWVDVEAEVEFDIDINDIINSISESSDHKGAVTSAISNFHSFMSAVSDEIIESLTPRQREIISEYFIEISKRFVELTD
jgi:hypothetical protein